MAGYAAASPLALGGPPGWIAWAVVGTVVTVGSVIVGKEVYDAVTEDDAAPSTTGTQTQTVAETGTRTCENCDQRPYSVRVHAQGTDMGGTTAATIGAPAIIKPRVPVTAAEGLGLSTATWAMLNRRQQRARAQAKIRADAFISHCPPYGHSGPKSFYGPDRTGGKRFDVDSYGPGPNFIA